MPSRPAERRRRREKSRSRSRDRPKRARRRRSGSRERRRRHSRSPTRRNRRRRDREDDAVDKRKAEECAKQIPFIAFTEATDATTRSSSLLKPKKDSQTILSAFQKKQLQERENLRARMRSKLKKPTNKSSSDGKVDSIGAKLKRKLPAKAASNKLKDMQKAVSRNLQRTAQRDSKLTAVVFKSMEEPEKLSDNYSVPFSSLLRTKIKEADKHNAIMDALNDDDAEDLNKAVYVSNPLHDSIQTLTDSADHSHANAIFSNPHAKPVPLPHSHTTNNRAKQRHNSTLTGLPKMYADAEALASASSRTRRAGLGHASREEARESFSNARADEDAWAAERERRWAENASKNGRKADDSDDWSSDGGSDSDKYTRIRQREYKTDLRAEKIVSEKQGSGKMSWREKMMQRRKREAAAEREGGGGGGEPK